MAANANVLVEHGRATARWAVIFLFLRHILSFVSNRIWPHGIDPWTTGTKLVYCGFDLLVAPRALLLYFGPSPSYGQLCDELPESRLEMMGMACGYFIFDFLAMIHDVIREGGVNHGVSMFLHHVYMFTVYFLSPLGPLRSLFCMLGKPLLKA